VTEADARAHRAGFVALLGPPNAGKSTLLNRLLGEKLAIVTAKPQTTRSRILGILTLPGAQLLLQDTPGLHESPKKLNQVLNAAVTEVAQDCDVALLLVDRSSGWTPVHDALLSRLRAQGKPHLVVGTKCDGPDAKDLVWPPVAVDAGEVVCSISARTGEGVAQLLEQIIEGLPESPPLYPEDELTDRPLRWLCAELVRESIFECLRQELPYSMAVEILSFDESRPGLVTLDANVLIERDSQKRIVVGAGGAMIKRIGIRARVAIEKLLGVKVHLQLFVKVDPRWLKSARRIEELGYY
jgi:GTP-binding protein Era